MTGRRCTIPKMKPPGGTSMHPETWFSSFVPFLSNRKVTDIPLPHGKVERKARSILDSSVFRAVYQTTKTQQCIKTEVLSWRVGSSL